MNIRSAISTGTDLLARAEIAEPRRETSALLALAVMRDAVFLIAHPEYELTIDETAMFDEFIRRRAGREPFHYIVGRKEFFGLDFEVSPDVLIPRPETEILVEEAIRFLSTLSDPAFCEIGVGSGCISISILHSNLRATAVAGDISDPALSLAARNARVHHVSNRLSLRRSDIFEGIGGEFDLIVSNPPYIPDDDCHSLQPEVGLFEPHSALFGGPDGLAAVKRILDGAPRLLRRGGLILIEIGFGQADKVREIFLQADWRNIHFLNDLQGIPRIAAAQIASDLKHKS